MKQNSSPKKENLFLAFMVCLLAYVLALAVAIGIGYLLHNQMHIIAVVLIADIFATLVIYVFSHIFKNTSLYDPYWSLAPIPIALFWMVYSDSHTSLSVTQIIVLVIVALYGIRLTLNWIRGWQGLKHEDWRYTKYRDENPKLFWLINLTGLQLMPTSLVFLGCLSLYAVFYSSNTSFGYLDAIGIIISLMGIAMETVSDEQLRKFKKTKEKGQLMTSGLWSVSRHPNYFGEISFWWGLFFFALSADLSNWWMIVGPVSITILFFVISIPMMEKKLLERYPQYAEYKKKVSMFFPWFQKK